MAPPVTRPMRRRSSRRPPTRRATSIGTGAPSGKPAEGGQNGARGSGDDLARLREDVNRQMADVRELMDQLSRDEGRQERGGMGFTFEGQGMTLSAPGTQSWKQDFAKWQQ